MSAEVLNSLEKRGRGGRGGGGGEGGGEGGGGEGGGGGGEKEEGKERERKSEKERGKKEKGGRVRGKGKQGVSTTDSPPTHPGDLPCAASTKMSKTLSAILSQRVCISSCSLCEGVRV